MEFDARVRAVRRFNRFYTARIGVLRRGLFGSRFSLAESRVLYELAHQDRPTATDLARTLDLDAGYLSRLMRGFSRHGLVRRTPSTADGRRSHLSLTVRGKRAAVQLDARSQRDTGAMLQRLSTDDHRRLVDAMRTIEDLLGERAVDRAPYLLRPPQPGDMGWVVNRHGALYAEEHGYDRHFEALVASLVSTFVETFDEKRERCWIAERDGRNAGSVFIVRKSARVAKLRMLIVEPEARGLGIGARLIEECIRFSRQAGYRTITLWTHSQLHAARRLYQAAGFRLAGSKAGHSFGKDLVDETWELTL